MTTGSVAKGETILRDASASAATYNVGSGVVSNYSNVFAVQAGNAMTLNSYLLGDIDGDYAGQIA